MRKNGKIFVVDERNMSTSWDTIEEVEEWSGLDIPNWCDEIRFNDRELAINNSDTGKIIVYKDIFGSWGSPTEG